MSVIATSTRGRILAAATELFGSRGVDAVSLDEIAAAVGVRKQTVLYWFATKDELVDAVFADAVAQMGAVIEAAVRAAPDEPLARVDSVVGAVFRAAVRTPPLLGLMRELSRLSEARAARLRERLVPLVDRAVAYLGEEMDAGRVRRSDPRLLASLAAATVTGIATDPEALRAVGWRADLVELRRLRNELRSFLRAALSPSPAQGSPSPARASPTRHPSSVITASSSSIQDDTRIHVAPASTRRSRTSASGTPG